jgi:hypothetical protein
MGAAEHLTDEELIETGAEQCPAGVTPTWYWPSGGRCMRPEGHEGECEL